MTNPNALGGAVQALSGQHSRDVMQIAVMVALSKRLLQHYGAANSVDLSGTIRTLDKCVESHLIEHDIHPKRLQEALHALQGAEIAVAHT